MATGSLESRIVYGSSGWYQKYKSAEWSTKMDFEQISCPLEPSKHKRPGSRIGTLEVILPTTRIGDFAWTVYSEPMVTTRVRLLMEENAFTGLRFDPVKVEKAKYSRGGDAAVLPTLWELVVTGKGGDADPDSGIRLLYECPGCRLRRYSSFRNGIIVDKQNWEGTDFFTVNGYPKLILVTERVKDFVILHKLTNCLLVRSRDLEWGDGPRPEEPLSVS